MVATRDPSVHEIQNAEAGVREGEEILARLQRDLEEAGQRREFLAVERSRLAFAAYGAGDEKAPAQVAALDLEDLSLDAKRKGLAAAIVEAENRLQAARQKLAAAHQKKAARQAKTHVAALRKSGDDIARHLHGFINAHRNATTVVAELHRSNMLRQHSELGGIALTNATITTFQRDALDIHRTMGARFLAPMERHDIQELIEGWASSVEQRADSILQAEFRDKETHDAA
jgi:hypothetical protein